MVVLAFLGTTPGWSQISLPQAAKSDPAALEAAIPELARRALAFPATDAERNLERRVGRHEIAFASAGMRRVVLAHPMRIPGVRCNSN